MSFTTKAEFYLKKKREWKILVAGVLIGLILAISAQFMFLSLDEVVYYDTTKNETFIKIRQGESILFDNPVDTFNLFVIIGVVITLIVGWLYYKKISGISYIYEDFKIQTNNINKWAVKFKKDIQENILDVEGLQVDSKRPENGEEYRFEIVHKEPSSGYPSKEDITNYLRILIYTTHVRVELLKSFDEGILRVSRQIEGILSKTKN